MLADVIKNRLPLLFVPLTEFPESNDPATWSRVPFTLNQSPEAIPDVIWQEDNLLATYTLLIDGVVSEPCTCKCVGVIFENQGVCVTYVSPQYLDGEVLMTLNVQIQIGPWEL